MLLSVILGSFRRVYLPVAAAAAITVN